MLFITSILMETVFTVVTSCEHWLKIFVVILLSTGLQSLFQQLCPHVYFHLFLVGLASLRFWKNHSKGLRAAISLLFLVWVKRRGSLIMSLLTGIMSCSLVVSLLS